MNRLNYDIKYLDKKHNGFNNSQIVSSVRPAWTYPIKDMKQPRSWVWGTVVSALAALLVFWVFVVLAWV